MRQKKVIHRLTFLIAITIAILTKGAKKFKYNSNVIIIIVIIHDSNDISEITMAIAAVTDYIICEYILVSFP